VSHQGCVLWNSRPLPLKLHEPLQFISGFTANFTKSLFLRASDQACIPLDTTFLVLLEYCPVHSTTDRLRVIVLGMAVYRNQACRCSPAKTIHYVKTTEGRMRIPDHLPNCSCQVYRTVKTYSRGFAASCRVSNRADCT